PSDSLLSRFRVFFLLHPPLAYIYTLSLHDALPISRGHRRRDPRGARVAARCPPRAVARAPRSRLRPPPAARGPVRDAEADRGGRDRKSTRLNSSHEWISYAVFCLKKKREQVTNTGP